MPDFTVLAGGRGAARFMEEREQGKKKPPALKANLAKLQAAPVEYTSLTRRAGDAALATVGGIGNLLDVPGSVVRDLQTWMPGGPAPHNPVDQLLPWNWFRSDNRITGEEMLEGYKVYDDGPAENRSTATNIGRFAGGIGLEIAMDPLTYLSFGVGAALRGGSAAAKGARALKGIGLLDDASFIATKAKRAATKDPKAFVGPREARQALKIKDVLNDTNQVGDVEKIQKIQDLNRTKFRRALGDKVDDTEFEKILESPIQEGYGKFKLPFTDRGSVNLLSGDKGLTLARKLDALGDATRYGKYSPVRPLAANFRKSQDQAYTAEAQRNLTENRKRTEEAGALARQRMYDNIRTIQPLLDTDDVARRNEISGQILDYMESTRRKGEFTKDDKGRITRKRWTETPDEYYNRRKDLFPDLDPIKPHLDDIKKLLEEVRSEKGGRGIDFPDFSDPFIEHVPRSRQSKGGKFRRKSKQQVHEPVTFFGVKRQDHLRDIPGGTRLLNELSVNEKYAGKFHENVLNASDPDHGAYLALKEEFMNDVGTKMAEIANEQGIDFALRDWEHADRLFDQFAIRIPEVDSRAGVTMFNPNAADSSLRSIESAYRATSEAGILRNVMKRNYSLPESTSQQDFESHARAQFGSEDKFVGRGINAMRDYAGRMADATEQSLQSIYSRFGIVRKDAPPGGSPPPKPPGTGPSGGPGSGPGGGGGGPDAPPPAPKPPTPQEAKEAEAIADVEDMFEEAKGDAKAEPWVKPEGWVPKRPGFDMDKRRRWEEKEGLREPHVPQPIPPDPTLPPSPRQKRSAAERLAAARKMRDEAELDAPLPADDTSRQVAEIVDEIQPEATQPMMSLRDAGARLMSEQGGFTIRDLNRVSNEDDLIALADFGTTKQELVDLYGADALRTDMDGVIKQYVDHRINDGIAQTAPMVRAKINATRFGGGYVDPVTGEEFSIDDIMKNEALFDRMQVIRSDVDRARGYQKEAQAVADAKSRQRQVDLFMSEPQRKGQRFYTEGQLMNMSLGELRDIRGRLAATDATFNAARDDDHASHVKAILEQYRKIQAGEADVATKAADASAIPPGRKPTGKKGIGLAAFTKSRKPAKDTARGVMDRVVYPMPEAPPIKTRDEAAAEVVDATFGGEPSVPDLFGNAGIGIVGSPASRASDVLEAAKKPKPRPIDDSQPGLFRQAAENVDAKKSKYYEKVKEELDVLVDHDVIDKGDQEVVLAIVGQMKDEGQKRIADVSWGVTARGTDHYGSTVTRRKASSGELVPSRTDIYLSRDRGNSVPAGFTALHEIGHVFASYARKGDKSLKQADIDAYQEFVKEYDKLAKSGDLQRHFEQLYDPDMAKYLMTDHEEGFAQLLAESLTRRYLPAGMDAEATVRRRPLGKIEEIVMKMVDWVEEFVGKVRDKGQIGAEGTKRLDDLIDRLAYMKEDAAVKRAAKAEIDEAASIVKGAAGTADEAAAIARATDIVNDVAVRAAARDADLFSKVVDPDDVRKAQQAAAAQFEDAIADTAVKPKQPPKKAEPRSRADERGKKWQRVKEDLGIESVNTDATERKAIETLLRNIAREMNNGTIETPKMTAHSMVKGWFSDQNWRHPKAGNKKGNKSVASDAARQFGKAVLKANGGPSSAGANKAVLDVFRRWNLAQPDELAQEYRSLPEYRSLFTGDELDGEQDLIQAILDQASATKYSMHSPEVSEIAVGRGDIEQILKDKTPDELRVAPDAVEEAVIPDRASSVNDIGIDGAEVTQARDGVGHDGIEIHSMNPNSVAAQLGIEEGDILVGIDNGRVKTMDDAARLIEEYESKFTENPLRVSVWRNDTVEEFDLENTDLHSVFSGMGSEAGELVDDMPFQTVDGQRRGAVRGLYRDPSRWQQPTHRASEIIIEAYDNADGKTFVHEVAHIFRDGLAAVDPQLEMDARILYNVQDGDWSRLITRGSETMSAEEWFAKDWEKWAETGRAPTGFRAYYEAFKEYLQNLHSKMSGTPVTDKLDPELQKFFDKVLGPKSTQVSEQRNMWDTLIGSGYLNADATKTPNALAAMRATLGERDWNHAQAMVLERRVRAASGNTTSIRADEIEQLMEEAVADTVEETQANLASLAETLGIESLDVTAEETLRQFRLPSEIADDITRVMSMAINTGQHSTEPGLVNSTVEWYDWFQDLFKTHVTATHPGFHIRNGTSGFVQNAINGVYDPRAGKARKHNKYIQPYYDAGAILKGQTLKDANTIPGFEDMTPEEATEQIRRLAFSYGILDSPGQHRDLVSSVQGSVADAIPGARKAEGIFDWVKKRSKNKYPDQNPKGKIADHYATFIEASRGVGDAVEGGHRLGGLIALMRQGYDPAEAARRVNLLHVDYSNLSRMEKSYMRRIFPFYSFSRGMSDYVYDELTTRPGGPLAQTIRAANRGRDRDVSTPDYVSEGLSLPAGVNADGTRHFITGLGLMHEQPVQLLSPILAGDIQGSLFRIGSQMSPIIKAPLEAMFNESMFQSSPQGGRSLDDQDPLIGRTLSNIGNTLGLTDRTHPYKVGKMVELAASNSPAARYLSTTRQMFDPRKNVLQKGLAIGSGLRISSISPAAQDAVLRERAAEIMRGMGGKIFERTYIPDYELENMDPKERVEAERWMALMNLLAQRARDRKADAQ